MANSVQVERGAIMSVSGLDGRIPTDVVIYTYCDFSSTMGSRGQVPYQAEGPPLAVEQKDIITTWLQDPGDCDQQSKE